MTIPSVILQIDVNNSTHQMHNRGGGYISWRLLKY